MFVIDQDSCNVMQDIAGTDVCVSVVGSVSHALCPLTKDFELFGCHVSEFFSIVPVTDDADGHEVVCACHGIDPRLGFACIRLLDVLEPHDDFVFHCLQSLIMV